MEWPSRVRVVLLGPVLPHMGARKVPRWPHILLVCFEENSVWPIRLKVDCGRMVAEPSLARSTMDAAEKALGAPLVRI